MAETVYCIVCGQGSSRDDWQGKPNPACDSHTKQEIADAIKKASAASKSA